MQTENRDKLCKSPFAFSAKRNCSPYVFQIVVAGNGHRVADGHRFGHRDFHVAQGARCTETGERERESVYGLVFTIYGVNYAKCCIFYHNRCASVMCSAPKFMRTFSVHIIINSPHAKTQPARATINPSANFPACAHTSDPISVLLHIIRSHYRL